MDIEIVGYLAGIFTTVAFVPQLYHVVKTKSTKDISLGMFLIFCTGVMCWLIYGIFLKSPSMIIANSLIFIQAFVILLYKLKYK